ncbi:MULTISPECIES: hypothetical protein [Bosea]|uniref:hypothetical protein n=1 Tax=Bosea TaxID=85413 RepID=UPI00214FDD59|nr:MULTISPECIES: hypothetical protein [Bosea]MCR4521970.1 hypothetical protein [Bosea sp. 47.2.35]MDR6829552.1 hypothetical protein [Bosea robiniae]MDR6896435.1 hypothetical protein [Bosea sp. BE109]MDR7139833.1 hypothetical protein [Bosea sp. BE168]MDR7176445.1 hypothetical protein [Bosea sp. BE271]
MKQDDLSTCIAGLASAQISLFGILFKHLENRLGSEIKRDFADELGRIIDISEQSGQPIQPFQRIIFEHIADWLKSPERGWTPIVIDGAKAAQAMAATTAPSPTGHGTTTS